MLAERWVLIHVLQDLGTVPPPDFNVLASQVALRILGSTRDGYDFAVPLRSRW